MSHHVSEVLDKAPAFIEDYEPLDMREKLWAIWVGESSRFARVDDLGDYCQWVIAAIHEHELTRLLARGWKYGPPPPCEIVQRSVSALLADCEKPSLYDGGTPRGVAIIDGYPNVARYIEAKPGER